MIIKLIRDKNKFRLVVNNMKIYNDKSLTLSKILKMIKTQKVNEDLIIENK